MTSSLNNTVFNNTSDCLVEEILLEGWASLVGVVDRFRESTEMRLEDERCNKVQIYDLDDSLRINGCIKGVLQYPETEKVYCCKDSVGIVQGIMVLSIGEVARLEYLYTNPDNLRGAEHARRGVGFRLLQEAIEIARLRKINQITLNALPNALPVYQHFGFQADPRDFGYATILCWLEVPVEVYTAST
jgi:hypothetical protein